MSAQLTCLWPLGQAISVFTATSYVFFWGGVPFRDPTDIIFALWFIAPAFSRFAP